MAKATNNNDDRDILAELAARTSGAKASKAADAVTLADVVAGDGLANLQAVAGRATAADVSAVAGAVVSLTAARLRAFAVACEAMAAELDMAKVRVTTRDGIKCNTYVMVRWADRGSDRESFTALNFAMPESYAPVFAPSAKRTRSIPEEDANAAPVTVTRKAK
jgi:hypothetical protein